MNRPSLRAAINAMCKGCIYDPGSGAGSWREQVQACSSGNCPLHSVRPLPVKARKTDEEARDAASAIVAVDDAGSALGNAKISRNAVMMDERRAA